MRRIMIRLAVVAVVLLLSISAAQACGDKSLRIGRGVRFLRTAHPATVLIYLSADPPAAAAARAPKLQAYLEEIVGHKAQTVQGADALDRALRAGKYDIVVTDFAEGSTVRGQIESSISHAVVVAVVSTGKKTDVAMAQKQYGHIVKNPNSADQYRDAIEDVLRSRLRVLTKAI